MGQFQRHVVGGGVNHLGGRRGGVGCGFSGPGGPCGERNVAFDSTLCCFLVVLEEEGEGEGGFQFRRWRVGGGQNHHAGLNSGHGRAGGRHRADRGAVRWRRLPGLRRGEAVPSLQLGHPRATTVSAAAGRLAHAVDDIPMRGVSACASGRAAPSLHPHPPAGKGRIPKNGGGGVHPPPGGGRYHHGEGR